MNDVEKTLRPGLRRLPEDLVPAASRVRPEDVVAAYRRRRRARAGLLAVAATVAVVAVGVPALVISIGSGSSPAPAGGTATSSASSSVSAAPSAPADPGRADLQAVAAQITRPYRFTVPSSLPTTCPDLGPALSRALGEQIVYWQGSLGEGSADVSTPPSRAPRATRCRMTASGSASPS